MTDKSYWATGGSAVFNAEEGNWQFASAGIVAPNNCTYIRVVLQMNRQMNFADFTGIYLYPEAFGTQYIYDKNGNRKTRKMLYGGQEKSEFDDADNLTKHTAAGRTVSSTFSYGDTEAEQKKHLLLKSIAPLGSVGTFTYDAFGNPLTSQVQNADANPSYFIRGETTYTDDGNYVTEQKDARGKIVRTETDPQRGTTTSVTDAKGQTVEYKYDELRRIVKTSANVGAKEGIPTVHNEYTYDEQRGNLVEIRHNTDGNAANDVVYTFEQDALGRQTAVKVGNQTLSQSAYQNDPTKPNFGTLTATTYGNGAKIRSRYDDFNRVTGVVYGEETTPRYEYDYNAKGQVARVRDNLLNRTTQSEYDLANRPVRVKTSEDAKHVYTGQVAYDNVYGNLSEFTEKVGENRQEFGTKFGYDDENRPTSLTYSASGKEIGQSTTTIDKLNRTTFSTVKLGSKTFTSEYHFAAGGYGTGSVTNLVSSITQPGCNCGYGYDDNGNIASATLNGKWTGYTYDALGQLIQVNDHSDTRSGENGTTWKYTYDLGGNILKKERFAYADTTTPLETVTYTYGDANWRDKLTAVNGNAIRYDAIGNPLSDGTWTYIWQNGRQLQKMQKAGVTAEFVYNADGLRVQKTVNGVATKYTLHGKNIVHMTSGTDELHFFYDAQNRPAVVVYNGTAYAYVKSLQGDIVAILDENGNTVVSYGYDAWGAPLWCTGELAETLGKVQPFRYRGYVFDEETGLYYLRSRYYNVEENRFLSADEGIIVSNKLMTGNMYAYGKNTPICIEDSEGTDAYWLTDIDNVYGFGHTSLLIEDSQTHKWYYFFWGSQSGGIASKAKIQLIEIESVPFDSSGRLDLAAFNIILSTTLVDESTPIENQEYIYDNFYETATLFRCNTTPSYLRAKRILEEGSLEGEQYQVLAYNCMQVSSYVLAASFSAYYQESFENIASAIVPNDARYLISSMSRETVTDYSHYAPEGIEKMIIDSIDNFAKHR